MEALRRSSLHYRRRAKVFVARPRGLVEELIQELAPDGADSRAITASAIGLDVS
jgi:hypothetical protein